MCHLHLTRKKCNINMILWVKNNYKFIYAALIIAAVSGFFMSAVFVKIDMLSISEGFGVRDIFSLLGKNQPSQAGISSQTRLLELLRDNDVFAKAKTKFVMSIGAYFIVMLLLLINFILVLIKDVLKKWKWKKAAAVISTISVVSFALFSYAGYSIMSLSVFLYSALEESLGFFATLVNISEIVKISLGTGYWLTFAALAAIFAIEIVTIIMFIRLYLVSRKSVSTQL